MGGLPSMCAPAEFRHAWQQPLRTAGFILCADPDTADRRSPLSPEITDGLIGVSDGHTEAYLAINPQARAGGADAMRVQCVPRRGDKQSYILAGMVERILLASGLRTSGPHWQPLSELYISHAENPPAARSLIAGAWKPVETDQHPGAAVPTDYAGTVLLNGASVTFYEGPGIDPGTLKPRRYIAVAYRPGLISLLRNRSEVRHMVAKALTAAGYDLIDTSLPQDDFRRSCCS